MPSTLRVLPAEDADLPRLMSIMLPVFEANEGQQLFENTLSNLPAVVQRYLSAGREHERVYGEPMTWKCVLTEETPSSPPSSPLSSSPPPDPKETIIAHATWLIYPSPRPSSEYLRLRWLASGTWIADPVRRARAQRAMAPFHAARVRWLGGRAHGSLTGLAIDPSFRRRGAGTAMVAAGLARCAQLGIPAYLVASPEGKPVYAAMGFEVVEELELEMEGSGEGEKGKAPAMMWWPPGTAEEEKKPALPEHRWVG